LGITSSSSSSYCYCYYFRQEAAKGLRELQSPSTHHIFVDVTFSHALEKKASERNATGKLLLFLLCDGVLTAQQYVKGYVYFFWK